jgi:hypothetical protein
MVLKKSTPPPSIGVDRVLAECRRAGAVTTETRSLAKATASSIYISAYQKCAAAGC